MLVGNNQTISPGWGILTIHTNQLDTRPCFLSCWLMLVDIPFPAYLIAKNIELLLSFHIPLDLAKSWIFQPII